MQITLLSNPKYNILTKVVSQYLCRLHYSQTQELNLSIEQSLSTYVDYITLKPLFILSNKLDSLSTYVDYITLKPRAGTHVVAIGLSTYVDYITLKPFAPFGKWLFGLSTYVDYITLKPTKQLKIQILVLVPMQITLLSNQSTIRAFKKSVLVPMQITLLSNYCSC